MTGGVGGMLLELRRAAAWHRRLLAAGLAAAAVAFGLQALSPAPLHLSPVLVAARDLAGGARLSADDLTIRSMPPAALPAGVISTRSAAVGRVLAAAMRTGEPLTDVRLIGPSLLAHLGSSRVAAPVRIADAAAVALLRPGDVVDVVAAAPAANGVSGGAAVSGLGGGLASSPQAAVLAPGARVLTVPSLGDATTAAEGALVVVAVDEETALALAGAAVSARLSIVLRPE